MVAVEPPNTPDNDHHRSLESVPCAQARQAAEMAITGVHTLLYSSEPEKLREVLRDVFGWKHVDAGEGWLIFALPPSEMGVHPGEKPAHEISLLCDDIETTVAELAAKGVPSNGKIEDQGFGITTTITLPGGVEVLLYQPRHPLAHG